jgi:hypothetical protein
MTHHPPRDSEDWRDRQERRRRRLRASFDESRTPRHHPPRSPDGPRPWWKPSLDFLFESPLGLLLLILAIAALLYFLLP